MLSLTYANEVGSFFFVLQSLEPIIHVEEKGNAKFTLEKYCEVGTFDVTSRRGSHHMRQLDEPQRHPGSLATCDDYKSQFTDKI